MHRLISRAAVQASAASIQAFPAYADVIPRGTCSRPSSITLTDSGNDFQGPVSLTGGTVQITDSNGLTLGTVSAIDLTLTSTGLTPAAPVDTTGTFTATTNGGPVAQPRGVLDVGGTSSVNGGTGAVALTGSNDFQGAVSLTSGDATLVNSNALTLGTINTANLTASSNGPLDLGSGTVSGSLEAASSGGAINQSGALTVSGTSALNRDDGAITLTSAGNDFGGVVSDRRYGSDRRF